MKRRLAALSRLGLRRLASRLVGPRLGPLEGLGHPRRHILGRNRADVAQAAAADRAAGLAVAFIAIIADRILSASAQRARRKMGMSW